VATGPLNVGGTTIRFFNTADSLYFSIEVLSGEINDYQIFFNTSEENEYKISNDSLFKTDGNSWLFQTKLEAFGNGHFFESGLKLSEIEFTNIDNLLAGTWVNGTDIWGKGESFSYRKYGSISVPENFKLKPSVSDPYHTIKIQWTPKSGIGGFIIERSTNDSLHFEQIADLPHSKNYYLNSGLDSANIYYYRMFSYIGINPSAYTQTGRMKTGWVGIQESNEALASKVQVIPNPAHNKTSIHLQFKKPEEVEIVLYNLNHKKVSDLFSGTTGERSISFDTNGLSSGIYLVSIKIQGSQIFKKLIIY
jgi:hypothetical protein